MSDKVEIQKVVSFTYQLLDENGSLLEQSDIPTSYVHGVDERIFPRITEALEGKRVGDEVEVVLPPEEGFGQYNPDLTFEDDIVNVPGEFQEVGVEAMFHNDAGETMTMRVVNVDEAKVYLDGNHVFAGKTMIFRIKIHDIRSESEQETNREESPTGSESNTLH